MASFRSDEYEALVNVLREAREEAGLRHDELSARVDRGRTWVYAIEHMGRRVDADEVRRLSLALGLGPLGIFERWVSRLGVHEGAKA